MHPEPSLLFSCVLSPKLPIGSISRNFSVIPSASYGKKRDNKPTQTDRFFFHLFTRYLCFFGFFFSWYLNDGVGTERNTNRLFKNG